MVAAGTSASSGKSLPITKDDVANHVRRPVVVHRDDRPAPPQLHHHAASGRPMGRLAPGPDVGCTPRPSQPMPTAMSGPSLPGVIHKARWSIGAWHESPPTRSATESSPPAPAGASWTWPTGRRSSSPDRVGYLVGQRSQVRLWSPFLRDRARGVLDARRGGCDRMVRPPTTPGGRIKRIGRQRTKAVCTSCPVCLALTVRRTVEGGSGPAP